MSKRVALAVALLVLIVVAVTVLSVWLAGRTESEAPASPAETAAATQPAPAAVEDQVREPAPEPEPATPPEDKGRVGRDPYIGMPEDYGLDPAEFHKLRLRTLTLGSPEAGEGPVALPAFRYVTLDRPIPLDYKHLMKAGMQLYAAVLDQKILTAAQFMVMLRKLDVTRCGQDTPGSYWEPALPVLPHVTAVKPPLVLKEQPASTVLNDPDRSLLSDPLEWCRSLAEQTQGRFAGDVLFRTRGRIPLDVDTATRPVHADFLLILD